MKAHKPVLHCFDQQPSLSANGQRCWVEFGKRSTWSISVPVCVCVCIHLARVLHWVYPSNNESSSRDANARLDYILMAIKITAPLLLHYYCCSRPLQCIYMCLRHFSAVLCLLLVPKNGFTFDLVALLNQSLLLLSEVMAKTEVDKSNIFNRFKLTPLVRTCICSKCVCVCVSYNVKIWTQMQMVTFLSSQIGINFSYLFTPHYYLTLVTR